MNGSLRSSRLAQRHGSVPQTEKPPPYSAIRSTDCVQAANGCKGRSCFLQGFFQAESLAELSGQTVCRRPIVPLATAPLGIVSLFLTPQERRRRIRATFSDGFPVGFRSRGPDRRKFARRSMRGESVQYLPGWTVQCINPECAARGHWLRAGDSGGELCSNCSAPLHNVPPPLGPRLRMRPRSLGSYRPMGRPSGRPR